jgi:anti-anti-sigma factor
MTHAEPSIRSIPAHATPSSTILRTELERLDGGITVIRVAGEIDMRSAPELRQQVEQAVPPGGHLVLDLEKVEFLASAGLSILVELARNAPERGMSWGIVATNRVVLRPLEAVGLLTIMPVHPTVECAVAAISAR